MIELGNDDVIRIEGGISPFINERTFLVEDLRNGGYQKTARPADRLFTNGVACQVLQLQSCVWKSGHIKLILMFEPDEEDEKDEISEEEVESSDEVVNEEVSPLDEIRKMAINEE